ncbi:MAG: hypothetical protein V7677_05455 [Motiliproteus sp.]
MNHVSAILIFTLSLLPAAAYAQEETPKAYKIEKHTEEVKQLRSSVDSLLQALNDAASQQDRRSLGQETSSKVKQLSKESDKLLAQGHVAEARQPLQRALVMIKIAINALKGAAPQDSANPSNAEEAETESASEFVIDKRKQDIAKLKSSIDALMQALTSIGEEKQQQGMVQDISQQVQEWSAQSDQLVKQGKLIQARQLVDQSLIEIKTAIGSLRDSETLIRSLDFASKEEEYAYEVDRFDTYQMLLQVMVLQKQTLTDSQRKQIQQWAADAREQRIKAGDQAAQGLHKDAVETLEGAGRTILKAIRRGGVYLPG